MVPAPVLLVVFVLGVLLGRSVWAMRRIGEAHSRVHGSAESRAAASASNDVRVVVVGNGEGLPRDEVGRYVLGDVDGEALDPGAIAELVAGYEAGGEVVSPADVREQVQR